MKEENSQEIFGLNHRANVPKFGISINTDLIIQKILNQIQKKSKKEKKEQEQRKKNDQYKKQVDSIDFHNSHCTIQDIWQRFIDIQEELIKRRCAPISIIPEDIEIDNDKLCVTIDDNYNEQKIDSLLKGILGLDSYNLESGYILVDELKWDTMQEKELEQVIKGLSECYVELDTTPTINAIINYGSDIVRYDQLSIDELYQLDTTLKNGNFIKGTIDDTVAFISQIYIDIDGYMKYLFGDHYDTCNKKEMDQNKSKSIELLEYYNQYIPWDVMEQYSNIGLCCKHYTLIFKINNQRAKEELKNCYDCYFPDTDTFNFCRKFTKKAPCYKDYIIEVNHNIQTFINEATIYCSKDEIEINVLFAYAISKHSLVKAKFIETGLYIKKQGNGYSFNDETGTIGIDFKWRINNIGDTLSKIEREIPFVKINVYDGHRFKCSVNSQLVGYESLKKRLADKYDNIFVQNNSVFHKIIIRLPYRELEHYELLRASLENDLNQLPITGINVQFVEKIPGKIRLNINYNKISRKEDLEDRFTEMRRTDFGFIHKNKEIIFGKLIKVNYPRLIFSIDTLDDTKEQIIEAFKTKAITTIIPILTGDLEKISRLKNAFTMATSGTELVNPRLQRFIFNSAEATKTKDIDLMLRRDGFVYKELCEHLLNSMVNESQKDAIIKAMYAEDLAIIQGPPGTGKSTAIAELIWQLVRKGLQQGNKHERILLTSETNLAVDNAISRIVNNKNNLVKPIRFGGEDKLESEGLQFSIDLMKRWVEKGDLCFFETEPDEETDSIVPNNLILKNWLYNREFQLMRSKNIG